MILNKKRKNKLLAAVALGAFVLGAGAIGSFSAVEASAEGSSLAMVDGASVRTDDKRAIRFTSTIEIGELNGYIEAGKDVKVVTMITSTNYLDEGEVFDANTEWEENEKAKNVVFSQANENLTAVKGKWDATQGRWVTVTDDTATHYLFNACLYDIEDEKLTREFSARSYIELNGVIEAYTEYSADKNSRCIWDVAEKALPDYAASNTDKTDEPYDYLSVLCAQYDVAVTSAYTGETTTVKVKRGVKLSADDQYAEVTANVDGQAYFKGLMNGETTYADEIVTSNLTLTANYNALEFVTDPYDETKLAVKMGTLTANDTTAVKIPATFKGKDVATVAASGFSGSAFTHVYLPNTVTVIQASAFNSCKELQFIDLGGVSKIGRDYDTSITTLGTAQINAFLYCDKLMTVVVKKDLNVVHQTFIKDPNATTEPVGITVYAKEVGGVFEYTSANSLLTGKKYDYTENAAFCQTWGWNDSQTDIEFNENEHVGGADGYCTHENCYGVTDASKAVYYDWDEERKTYYVKKNPAFTSAVVRVAETFNDGIHGNASVTYIGVKAFESNTKITHVYLPDSVTEIKGRAFQLCTNLQFIKMLGVSEVGKTESDNNAFLACNKLKTVIIQKGLKSTNQTFVKGSSSDPEVIDFYAMEKGGTIEMRDADTLWKGTTVKVNPGTPYQGNIYYYDANGACGTWEWKDNQDGVSLVAHSERKDGYCAKCFTKLNASKAVDYAWDDTAKAYYVAGDSTITSATVYVEGTFSDGEHGVADVTYIGVKAFESNTKITHVYLPDSVEEIKGQAFQLCTNLQFIKMLGVSEVGKTERDSNAFLACNKLKTVIIQKGLKSTNQTFVKGSSSDPEVIDFYAMEKGGTIEMRDADTLWKGTTVKVNPGTPYQGNIYYYDENGACGTWEWKDNQDGVSLVAHSERKDGYCAKCFTKLNASKAVDYAWDDTAKAYYVVGDSTLTSATVYVEGTFSDGEHGEKAVTYIGKKAFYDNQNITHVYLPDSVIVLQEQAFALCKSLAFIDLGGIEKLGRDYTWNDTGNGNGYYTAQNNVFLACNALRIVIINGNLNVDTATFVKGSQAGDYGFSIYTDAASATVNMHSGATLWTADSKVYYYSKEEPTTSGNYWHYDENGVVKVW